MRGGPGGGQDPSEETGLARLGIAAIAIGGRCPRCGAKTLFAGMTAFAPACPSCGLAFASFDVGDGPAAFLTLILGALVVAAAVTLELTLHPPLWLHMVIWIPVTALGVIGSLRIAKAALLAAEFGAAERGRSTPPE